MKWHEPYLNVLARFVGTLLVDPSDLLAWNRPTSESLEASSASTLSIVWFGVGKCCPNVAARAEGLSGKISSSLSSRYMMRSRLTSRFFLLKFFMCLLDCSVTIQEWNSSSSFPDFLNDNFVSRLTFSQSATRSSRCLSCSALYSALR